MLLIARYDIPPLIRSPDSTKEFAKTKQEINFHGPKRRNRIRAFVIDYLASRRMLF